MISDTDRSTIDRIARKYHAKRVLLFGSSLSDAQQARDIDLGVEGVQDRDYFAFYGELLCALSKPVDIVDLSVRNRFAAMVEDEGVLIYA